MIDFDTYGVPSYFMHVPVIEHLGGGNVRIWNCERRDGVLRPVCGVIIHSTDLIAASHIVGEAGLEALKFEWKKEVLGLHGIH